MKKKTKSQWLELLAVFGALLLSSNILFAYCETLGDLLVRDARKALDQRKVELAFKWVDKDRESEIRTAFDRAVRERERNPATREATDGIFFEIVGRVHCEGENFPFFGMNPAGPDVHPVRQAIDRALSTDEVNDLTQMITSEVSKGIQERFDKVRQLEPGQQDDLDVGRQYVETYVDYVNYVEKIHRDAEERRNDSKNG
ncbi:MAG: DUF6448 family protein [Candidatus Omnitrophota bacterium]|jgi:hypothetical protein